MVNEIMNTAKWTPECQKIMKTTMAMILDKGVHAMLKKDSEGYLSFELG
jgi:hypothetical protein